MSLIQPQEQTNLRVQEAGCPISTSLPQNAIKINQQLYCISQLHLSDLRQSIAAIFDGLQYFEDLIRPTADKENIISPHIQRSVA